MYHILGRSRWISTNAPALLQQYLFLLPFLGINGILEAFVQAVATEQELAQMSFSMLIWSGVYCVTCFVSVSYIGMKEGALIIANGISMICRIIYSILFIRKYFGNRETEVKLGYLLTDAKASILACSIAAAVMRWSSYHFFWKTLSGFAAHIAVGGFCFMICLAIS